MRISIEQDDDFNHIGTCDLYPNLRVKEDSFKAAYDELCKQMRTEINLQTDYAINKYESPLLAHLDKCRVMSGKELKELML